MSRCPACSLELPQPGRFCPGCGAALAAPCPEPTGPYQPAPATPPAPSDPSPDPPRFPPGTLLAGRFRVVALLGKGGMGEVYRADDLKLSQPVALKFLPEALARDAGRLARLHGEVRVARQVSHPNVCRVYDAAEADGQPFLIMEYIDGQDLAALLRQVGRLPEDRGVELARQLCLGLAAVHGQGILHRDLKPRNIMIDGRGQARLTDFGLAGFAESLAGDVRAGTPSYMAPEQRAGREVSAQSDLYALGLVLYELFTGRKAFAGRSGEEGTPSKPTAHVTGLNQAVERVILRCLEREPKDRPRSALAVAAALPGGDPLAAALAAGETPSPQTVADAGGAGGLRPAVAAACLAGVLLLLAAVTFLSAKARLINCVPLPERPEFLARRAQEVLRDLGYEEPSGDRAWGFAPDFFYLAYLQASRAPPGPWDRLAAGRPPALVFWYRQGPRPLVPAQLVLRFAAPSNSGMVNRQDPPPVRPGMAGLDLDPQGRLVGLQVVPEAADQNSDAPAEPDWSRLFALAGLDPKDFRQARPAWNPPVHSDVRAAWEGAVPGADLPLRLEAAAYKGRVVSFQQIGPWITPEHNPSTEAGPPNTAGQVTLVALEIALWVGAVLLALRHARLGRWDRAGAARLVGAVFLLGLGGYLLWAHHVATGQEMQLLSRGVALALFLAALQGLFYVAAEPLVRRWWPHALISWSRLLDGRLRDPLVGRDLLIGTLGGLLVALAWQGSVLVPAWFGLPSRGPTWDVLPVLLGGWHVAASFLMGVTDAFDDALVDLVLLLVLRIVLRKQALVVAAFALLFAAHFLLQSPLGGAFYAVGFMTAAVVLIRYGLLAAVALCAVYGLLLFWVPLTPDLSAWYAPAGLVGVAAVVLLAGYGFWTALGDRPLFARGWLGDE